MPLSFDQLILGPCLAAFGEAAQGQPVPVYTPSGGAPFALDGVFDEGFDTLNLLGGPTISTVMPVFGVRLVQFPVGVTPKQGDAVRIRGQNYLVKDVQPDSHGFAKLMLNATGAFTPGDQFLGG